MLILALLPLSRFEHYDPDVSLLLDQVPARSRGKDLRRVESHFAWLQLAADTDSVIFGRRAEDFADDKPLTIVLQPLLWFEGFGELAGSWITSNDRIKLAKRRIMCNTFLLIMIGLARSIGRVAAPIKRHITPRFGGVLVYRDSLSVV